ncbi:cysteine desulfurase family protein [[Eubacterium] cellulosolvens]
MKRIYVDYAATTPIDSQVLAAMKPYLTSIYGNAESINTFGMEARKAVEESRKKIAKFMNADSSEVIFTGCATEANNMVLKGHAFQKGKDQAHIAVSKIEHKSVLNPASWLQNMGYNVTYIPVDKYGILNMVNLEEILKNNVTLVSVIHGNNEIGTLQSPSDIGKLCHKYGAYFHTDAAQTFGKIPIDVKAMNIDFLTANAHKIYGPKGIGVLYLNRDANIEPLLHGGEHEFGLRAGTHNVPGAAGFAKAVELREQEMKAEAERLTRLRDRLIEGALEINDTYLNGHPTKRLCNNINLRFSYITGESLVLQLDLEGIAASSASACSSRIEEASHVLLAIGIDPLDTRGSLRFSLGKYNTKDDVDIILDVLPEVVRKLRKMSPLPQNN